MAMVLVGGAHPAHEAGNPHMQYLNRSLYERLMAALIWGTAIVLGFGSLSARPGSTMICEYTPFLGFPAPSTN